MNGAYFLWEKRGMKEAQKGKEITAKELFNEV
jgi:hypothetical protein